MWEVVVFVLEALIFILIGLPLLAPDVAAIAAAMVVSRFVWMFPATYLLRLLLPWLRR